MNPWPWQIALFFFVMGYIVCELVKFFVRRHKFEKIVRAIESEKPKGGQRPPKRNPGPPKVFGEATGPTAVGHFDYGEIIFTEPATKVTPIKRKASRPTAKRKK